MRLRFSLVALAASGALSALNATFALAGENAQPDPSNLQKIPITAMPEGPENYPAGAAERGEEGMTLLMITSSDGALKVTQLMSSGHPDLDAAAADIASAAYKITTPPETKCIAVIWSLKQKTGAPSQMQSPSGP
jgi:outer membrane biosynthesis protein TonB